VTLPKAIDLVGRIEDPIVPTDLVAAGRRDGTDRGAHLTLVGRSHDRRELIERSTPSGGGQSSPAVVRGEPGIGKTALGTAFGLTEGLPPDRLFLGFAVLRLLSRAAEERPLVCLVDDARWLDQASSQVLSFVARRLVRSRSRSSPPPVRRTVAHERGPSVRYLLREPLRWRSGSVATESAGRQIVDEAKQPRHVVPWA
jgi:hypothetical protein